MIHVTNSRVFSDPTANYTDECPYVWHEILVLLTFESDWRRAKEILASALESHAASVADHATAAVRRASHRLLIFYRTLTPKAVSRREKLASTQAMSEIGLSSSPGFTYVFEAIPCCRSYSRR